MPERLYVDFDDHDLYWKDTLLLSTSSVGDKYWKNVFCSEKFLNRKVLNIRRKQNFSLFMREIEKAPCSVLNPFDHYQFQFC